MITGIDLTATINYTLKNDKDNPTIWKLGILPSYIMGKFSGAAKDADQMELLFKLVQVSLKGWENFNEIYKTERVNIFGREVEGVALELLEKIPLPAINEISNKILEINNLTSGEIKN
jgi:hypothetical protein